MNPITVFQPLPQGTTSSTLRRFVTIKPLIRPNQSVVVRVFAIESSSALQTLLTRDVADADVRVYVYPVESAEQEVTVLHQGKETHFKTCNIDESNDILSITAPDETARRQWRELLTSYTKEPYLIDLPVVETNNRLIQWFTVAHQRSPRVLLMDDVIDAVWRMLQAKTEHPFDEDYAVQTTAVAGVLFAGTVLQWSETLIQERIVAAKQAFVQGMPVTPVVLDAVDRFIWENQ